MQLNRNVTHNDPATYLLYQLKRYTESLPNITDYDTSPVLDDVHTPRLRW